MIYICHQRPPFLVTIRLEQLYCNKKGAFFGITFDAHPHSGWFICLERFAFSTGLIALQQGMKSVVKTISAIDEAKSAIESLKGKVDFIYIPTDNTLADGMTSVSMAANECGLPTIVGESGMVGNGALATFGINYYELGKSTAAMAVKILKGEAEPKDMPVEYQTDENVLEIAVNTETADKLGITIPDDVLSNATLLPEK